MGKLGLGSPQAGAAWRGRSTRATFLYAEQREVGGTSDSNKARERGGSWLEGVAQ
jgi:hypothetical protein